MMPDDPRQSPYYTLAIVLLLFAGFAACVVFVVLAVVAALEGLG